MKDRVEEAGQEASGVLSTAKSYLGLYRDPTLAKNLERSDFRIADLMHHSDPVSIYIVTQPNDKTRLKFLVRVLVNQIVRILASPMEFEAGQPKPAYKHRLLLILDEFPSLGKLDVMQDALAHMAGYGVKAYLVCQDLNQLEAHYGREEAITSACHIQVAFAPNRVETAELLSKLTGVTTVVREQVTKSGWGFSTNVSRTLQESARPILTADEARMLPGPRKDSNGLIVEGGDMLVCAAGSPVCYGRQTPYFLDPTFKARAAVPPPLTSDVLILDPEEPEDDPDSEPVTVPEDPEDDRLYF
jgi:type IV secretion system protein VirD4